MRKLENQIEKCEKEIKALTQELEKLQYGTDDFMSRYNKINELNKRLKDLYNLWEDIA